MDKFWKGFVIGGMEFGTGGFFGGTGNALAGGAKFGDAMKAGGIGFGMGFVTGGLIEGSYMAGWQNIAHGMSNDQYVEIKLNQINNLKQAGQLQAANDAFRQLNKSYNYLAAGRSEIAFDIQHGFLHAAKDGSTKTMGFDATPAGKVTLSFDIGSSGVIGGAQTVPGYVRPEPLSNIYRATFKFLTTDLAKVNAVWQNMDKVIWRNYNLYFSNCFHWSDAVLAESGMSPVGDAPWGDY